MIHSEREVIETPLLRAILNMIDTVHVGINDGVYPYVVPLSYGFDIDDERLEVYVHCALRGRKLTLMEKDPHVCCTFSTFSNFPKKMYKGHRHDYRSVMAFGVVEKLERSNDPKGYAKAIRAILDHYDRVPAKGEHRGFPNFDPKGIQKMHVLKITCKRENVFGKSEFPVRTLEDVPFIDVYNMPDNAEPFDISDLMRREKRPSAFED